MAAALLRILTDAELAGRLVAAGLREAQGYAWPRVRERLLEVYRQVLGSRAARPGHDTAG